MKLVLRKVKSFFRIAKKNGFDGSLNSISKISEKIKSTALILTKIHKIQF